MVTTATAPFFVHRLILDGEGACLKTADDARSNQVFLWEHIDLEVEGAADWLANHAKLDESAIHALTSEETRPRSFKTKNGAMVVLRGVNLYGEKQWILGIAEF